MQIASRYATWPTGRSLPYDAEIEYLESTGTQYIDTGVVPNSATTSLSTRAFLLTGSTASVLFGSRSAVNRNAFCAFYYPAGSSNPNILRYDFGDSASASNVQNMIPNVGSGWTEIETSGNEIAITQGGATTTTTARLASASNSFPIFVFGVNTGGTPTISAAPVRVSSFRILESGVLVRDYIPVRVGTVGCLYDRLGVGGMNPDGSARNDGLYYNRGTGDFVLGPDINPISARSYVQDGLIAMWDGIENAGYGVHDASATAWKNLVEGSSFPDFDIYAGGVWSENALAFVGLAATAKSDWPAYDNIDLAFRLDDGYIAFAPSARNRMPWSLWSGTSPGPAFSGGNFAAQKRYGYNIFMRGTSLSLSLAYSGEDVSTVYANGVAMPATTTQAQNTVASSVASIGSRVNVSSQYNTGRGVMWRIAIYSRALTSDEIAHNYTIDKARFNLP